MGGVARAPGPSGARVERGQRLAKPVGLAEQLVEAPLKLFAQTVDHVSLLFVLRERAIVHASRSAEPTSLSGHLDAVVGASARRIASTRPDRPFDAGGSAVRR